MNDQNYLILGANGGVGSETARRLCDAGARVLLAGRNESELSALSDQLGTPYHVMDATSFDSVQGSVQQAVEQFGSLHGAVNCVGSVLLKSAHLTTEDEWHETVAKNLTSAFALVRSACKAMRKTGGSVVLLSSAAARAGLVNHEAIAAAKGGVIGLAQSAAATYAGKNIRVNAVAPGLVKTKMTESIWSNEVAAKLSRSMHALGRLGEPKDIASAIVWLLDPANSWTTGQVIGVDGGLAMLHPSGK